jgi:hypothetical protein
MEIRLIGHLISENEVVFSSGGVCSFGCFFWVLFLSSYFDNQFIEQHFYMRDIILANINIHCVIILVRAINPGFSISWR